MTPQAPGPSIAPGGVPEPRTNLPQCMLSVSSPGTHFGDDQAARDLTREVNEFGAGLVRDHPGRFGQFASLPLPDVAGALREIAYALGDLGSDGAAIETNAHGHYLGDRRFDPVWAELDRRHAVVFVHPTSPPGYAAISLGQRAGELHPRRDGDVVEFRFNV
jgi:6-methylsalicylate decarboxylase